MGACRARSTRRSVLRLQDQLLPAGVDEPDRCRL